MELLAKAWKMTRKPKCVDIPVQKQELTRRIHEYPTKQTNTWLRTGVKTWRSVCDPITKHIIHVVSDRSFVELTDDLVLGLRLLSFMTIRTPVIWYWWDQPWDRILPPFVIPAQEHINGGWAVPNVPEVHVYRREEAHKVLIHETIHALGLDVTGPSLVQLHAQLESNLGRKIWPHVGEAYTELFAELLWSVVINRPWSVQVRCSERQASEVWSRIQTTRDPEDTNVFAYYILKWVLMQHLDEVMLSPQVSVVHWFDWWIQAKPHLLSKDKDKDKDKSISLGMTCS